MRANSDISLAWSIGRVSLEELPIVGTRQQTAEGKGEKRFPTII